MQRQKGLRKMFAQPKLTRRLSRTARGILAILLNIGLVLAIILVSPITVSAALSFDEPDTIFTVDL